MKRLLQTMMAVPALVVASILLVSVPVAARGGADDVSADTNQSTASTQPGSSTESTDSHTGTGDGTRPAAATNTRQTNGGDGSKSSSNESGTAAEAEIETHNGADDTGTLRQKGLALVAALEKDQKSAHSAADRTKACEAHKDGLATKFTSISTNSQDILNRINDIYGMAQTYQKGHGVTVTNWDTLVAAADSAKATATTSVASLQTLKPSLDCNSTSVASDVAAFKVAASETRDNLNAYKTAVKAVLTALKAVAAPTQGSTN